MAAIRLSSMLLAASILGCGGAAVAPPPALSQQPQSTIADQLGVTNTGARYQYSTSDFIMDEGRYRLAANSTEFGKGLGTHVMKLWFNRQYELQYPPAAYTGWGTINSLVDLAASGPYARAFGDPNFKTYMLEAGEFCHRDPNGDWDSTFWKNASFATDTTTQACVRQQFYDVTVALLNTYNNSGKTFILQNWEGDNDLSAKDFIPKPLQSETCPASSTTTFCIAVRNMATWLQLRQQGVTDARNATPHTNVTVAAAAEMNAITGFAADGTYTLPTMVDLVTPYLSMDLYSCSCYDANTPGNEYKITGILDYIQSKRHDSGLYGSQNVYLGEFSTYEDVYYQVKYGDNWNEISSQAARAITGQQLENALRWGARWVVFWELYSNGTKLDPNSTAYPAGVWLIRPPGGGVGGKQPDYSQTWDYFQSIMSTSLTDYRYIYEAENHWVSINSTEVPGSIHSETTDTYLSGGRADWLSSASIGSKITYSLDVPTSGNYTFSIRMKTGPTHGSFSVKVNTAPLGTSYDTYSPTTGYQTYTIFTGTMSAGTKTIDLVVDGKNVSSSDYDLIADYFRITP